MKAIKLFSILVLSTMILIPAKAGFREDIQAVNQQIIDAVAAQNVEAAVIHYTEDTTFLAPATPLLVGRDAVAAFYQGALAAGAVKLELETIDMKKIAKRKVVETGKNRIHFYDPASGQTFIQENKFIVVWKKTKDGWKVFYDAYNSFE